MNRIVYLAEKFADFIINLEGPYYICLINGSFWYIFFYQIEI